MKDLVNWESPFPEIHIPQKHLAKQLSQMELIAWKFRMAMDLQSSTHLYAVLKLMTTMQQTELLKQMSGSQLPPEAEESYKRLTAEYAAVMEAIPQHVAAQLLETLREVVPEDVPNQGLFATIRALLSE